jgi:hypothetical protein
MSRPTGEQGDVKVLSELIDSNTDMSLDRLTAVVAADATR